MAPRPTTPAGLRSSTGPPCRGGRQARYYSAALAGNAACGLAVWNACRRGRPSDHVLAGLAVGVLFHVHALSAVTMALVYVAALPLARRQPRLWLRALTAGSLGGLLVLPWAAAIRKEWLDRFADDLVVVEGPWFMGLQAADVQEAARRLGRELTPTEA